MNRLSPEVAPDVTVSVILTVYLRVGFLRQAIDSVLDQTLESYEILVVDDSNSSEIRPIVESYDNSKVHYRPNNVNLGVALSIREALRHCRGKYVAILNDDDTWEPTFLERLSEALDGDSNRDLAFCDHWIMDEWGVVDVKSTDANTEQYGRSELGEGVVSDLPRLVLIKNGVPLAMGSMFRKSSLDSSKLVREVSGAYDFWISCLLAAEGRKAYYVNERLTRYRIHSAMETGRKAAGKNANMVFIFKELIARKYFHEREELLRHRLSCAHRNFGNDLLRFDQPVAARSEFLSSINLEFNIKTIVLIIFSRLPNPLRRRMFERLDNSSTCPLRTADKPANARAKHLG